VPGKAILCTFTIPLALATQAFVNDVILKFNFPVKNIYCKNNITTIIESDKDKVHCRYVVNAAGIYGDVINAMFGHNEFTITPRRGELIVFDKFSRSLVNHIILPVPTPTTRGVLVSPTVYGNIIVGPTAENLVDKANTATSNNGLQTVLQKAYEIVPALMQEEITATYAGLRPATEHADYQIFLHKSQKYVCVGGIRSTGVSASLGIAEYVCELLENAGLSLKEKEHFKPVKMPNIGEAALRPYQCAEMIANNPDYGKIICHCERVSLGEILDATQSEIPATSIDALRRRTRVLQGRCQGFNCKGAIVSIMEKKTKTTLHELLALNK